MSPPRRRSRAAWVSSVVVAGILLLAALGAGGLWWGHRAVGSAECVMPRSASTTPWPASSSCSVVTLVRTSGNPTVSIASGTLIRLDFTLRPGESTFGAGTRQSSGAYRVTTPRFSPLTYQFGVNRAVCHDGAGTPSDCNSWIDREPVYTVSVLVRGSLIFGGPPQFVSPTAGWALGGGAIGNHGATETTVWRSEDGGRTWTDVTPAAFYSKSLPTFSDVQLDAIDAEFAFLVDLHRGSFYRTTDGGGQWTAIPIPSGWTGFEAEWPPRDPQTTGWSPGGLAAIGDGNVYILAPDSNTWAAHPLPTSIARAGALVEVSGSGPRLIATTPLPGLSVATSVDDGSTWQPAAAAPEGDISGSCPALPPFFQVFNQNDASLVTGCSTLRVWTTTDGGMHWTASPAGVSDAEWGGGTSVQAGRHVAPDFLDVTHGWVWQWTGTSVRLLSTTDGGQHWTPLPRSFPPMSTADFVTPSTGYVWTGRATFETTDGGQTWTQLPPPRVG